GNAQNEPAYVEQDTVESSNVFPEHGLTQREPQHLSLTCQQMGMNSTPVFGDPVRTGRVVTGHKRLSPDQRPAGTTESRAELCLLVGADERVERADFVHSHPSIH